MDSLLEFSLSLSVASLSVLSNASYSTDRSKSTTHSQYVPFSLLFEADSKVSTDSRVVVHG